MVTTSEGARSDHRLEEPDTSLGELASRLTNDLGQLIRTHIELAKEETRREVKTAGRAAGMLGGGVVAALVAVLMLSMAAAWGLAEVMAPGFAFLIVGAVWAAAATALFVVGRNKIADVDPAPTATMEEIEEDKQWLKKQR